MFLLIVDPRPKMMMIMMTTMTMMGHKGERGTVSGGINEHVSTYEDSIMKPTNTV
jgi:hypothetical protein